MVSFSELMIGGIGLLTAVAAGYGAFEQARLRRSVDTGSEATGSVRTGAADPCSELATAPLTGDPVVAAGLIVEKRAGSRAGWTRIATQVVGVPFRLAGETESTEVNPTGASVSALVASDANETELVADTVDDLPTPAQNTLDQLPPEHGKRRYTQIAIPEGDVTVVGETEPAGGSATCENVSTRISTASGGTFQLSDLDPESLRGERSLSSIAVRAVVAVMGATLAGIVFLT